MTPGVRIARSLNLRPLRGRFSALAVPMTSPREASSVWSRAWAAYTSTDCCAPATLITTLTFARWLICSTMPFCRSEANPLAETVTS